MNQNQYEHILSWTMLGTLHSAVIERQLFLGRPLTDAEYEDCHKKAHQNAEEIRDQLKLAREKHGE